MPKSPACSVAPVLFALLFANAVSPASARAASLLGGYFEALPGLPSGNSWYPVVGDVDRDGRDDLVRVSYNFGPTTALLIRFGEADGRLSASPLVLTVPGTVYDYAWPCIDDLDGDGNPDIVIGAETELVVCRGLGGRAFAPAVSIPDSAYGYVSSTDLNGDNVPDYACLYYPNSVQDSLRIRFGTGGLAFRPGPSFHIHGGAEGVHFRDFNGDHLPDILIGAQTTSTVLLNLSGGAFAQFDFSANYPFPAGDLNGDGFEDLVTSAGALLGNGDGTFQTPIPHGMASPQLTVDLNEDGRPDLVGIRTVSNAKYVSVMLGAGNGSFGPEILYLTQLSLGAIGTGDFDQDGHADLVLQSWDANFDGFMFGRGSGGFRQAARSFPAGVAGIVRVGRIGADADPDVVVASGTTVAVLNSLGPASLGPAVNYVAPFTVNAMSVGDLNHDNLDDVVLGNTSTATIAVGLAQPGGVLAPWQTIPTASGTRFLRMADIDGDGTPDLAAITWWRHGNGNGTFGPSNALPATLGIGPSFDVVDLDGNGALDFVGVSTAYGARVILASSPGVFPTFKDYPGFFGAVFSGTGFFNADTIRDVVVSSDSTWLFPGLGGGLLGPRISLGVGPGAAALAADLDGDGLTDLIGPSSGSQVVRVSRGTGGRMAPSVGYGIQFRSSGSGGMVLADMDGNGTQDVVVSELTRNVVTLLLNQTLTPTVGVPPAPRSTSHLAVRALPNPVRGEVSLRLDLASLAPVEVRMFDLAGRTVARAALTRPAGRNVDLALEQTRHLPPGVYLVRARQGVEATTTRVCVMR